MTVEQLLVLSYAPMTLFAVAVCASMPGLPVAGRILYATHDVRQIRTGRTERPVSEPRLFVRSP
jgi:hypothetical protein